MIFISDSYKRAELHFFFFFFTSSCGVVFHAATEKKPGVATCFSSVMSTFLDELYPLEKSVSDHFSCTVL